HVPVTFKLIEEAGPPGLETLRTWPKINERFREYLRSEGVSPEEVLPKDITQQLGLSLPAMGQEPIWEKVELGSGSPEEAKSNPALFYHSHRFRAVLFADTAARTVRLLEEIWGPQTRADSGSFYPSTGQGPVLDRGIEPFELFRRRGATWYSSEISWGWGGTPDFVGPQVASYEAALARSLAKYHQCPLGTYIISDPNRGYNGDFLERYAYTLISQGFTDLHFYVLAYPTECSFLSSTDVHKAIKRISYTAGALEDKLAGAEVVPAQVAIAWSATTDVWDLAHEPSGRWEVSNNIYPQERLLDYLLLRHAQVPADIISEQDFEDGYLDRYNVLFLVGDHLRRSAADKLRAWLRRGGVLIALAGGGLRDEYDRPVPEMLEVYGLRGEDLEKRQWCMRPKLELVHAAPIDRLRCSWRGASVAIDAYAFRHRLDPLPETQVIGRFSNGEAGAVVNRYGDGVAMLFGVLPGLAYVKPAIPTLPYGRGGTRELSRFIPTAYDAQIRDFMWHLLG
ncbi:MAG: hypothetical protein H5T86_15495, partial [Armatimonadetes bacterium]|nr:hypothetical protein [Armatimonadota bacterium]